MTYDQWSRPGGPFDNDRDDDGEIEARLSETEEWLKRRLAERPEHRVPCADSQCDYCHFVQEIAQLEDTSREFSKRLFSKPAPDDIVLAKPDAKQVAQALRAAEARQRRRGTPDERDARTKAVAETGGERLWNLFAEKRGGPFYDSGEQRRPEHLKYEVWADTRKNAKFLARHGTFAASSTARGIRSITSGDGVEQAPYLKVRRKR